MTAAWMQRRRYNPWRQLPQSYTQLLAWFGVRAHVGDIWRDSTGYHLERLEDDEDGVVFRLWCDQRDRRPIRASDLSFFRRTLDRLGHVGVWTPPSSQGAMP